MRLWANGYVRVLHNAPGPETPCETRFLKETIFTAFAVNTITNMFALRNTVRVAPKAFPRSFIGGVRTKVTLPELDYPLNGLEPYISEEIMNLHLNFHQANYVKGYNTAIEQAAEAKGKGEVTKIVDLQKAINFNGGGYVNHCLFWKNLAPTTQGGGQAPPADSNLAKQINQDYGSLENLIAETTNKMMGIQGSGWAWIVKNKVTGSLDVITTANQDQCPTTHVPLVALDCWEHAYYLDYKNAKAKYFEAIWHVINWKEAARRFDF